MSEKTPGRKSSGARRAGGKAARSPAAGSPLDFGWFQQIVDLMASKDVSVVDVRDGDKRIIVKRGPHVTYAAGSMGPMMQAAPATQPVPAPAPPSAPPAAPPPGDEDAGLVPIESPMVGTFYSKPDPESKAFVAVGSSVTEETEVCVIEAMKHFNPITAGCRGTIARVLVSDGESVDVGKRMFLVKPV